MNGDSERSLVLACLEIANLKGAYLELISQRGGRNSGTTKGAPDGFLYWAGRCQPVEFKAPDGRMSRVQQIAQKLRLDNGVTTHVIRDVQAFADLMR